LVLSSFDLNSSYHFYFFYDYYLVDQNDLKYFTLVAVEVGIKTKYTIISNKTAVATARPRN